MSAYGVRDVERLLRLSRATILGFIKKGLVEPVRGPRRAYLFSFQDVIVLRTAKALTSARIPTRRISRSIAELKRQLPVDVPLSGLNIAAVGSQVIVREGTDQWQVDSGQYLLALDVRVSGGIVEFVDRTGVPSAGADELFLRGAELEEVDAAAAAEAYKTAVRLNPELVGAWLNWGRLVHVGGDLTSAEVIYRDALTRSGRDALLLFNLAVVLEDSGRRADAVQIYLDAISEDDGFADAHYNVARLYEDAGESHAAIRHMARYRRLTHPGQR